MRFEICLCRNALGLTLRSALAWCIDASLSCSASLSIEPCKSALIVRFVRVKRVLLVKTDVFDVFECHRNRRVLFVVEIFQSFVRVNKRNLDQSRAERTSSEASQACDRLISDGRANTPRRQLSGCRKALASANERARAEKKNTHDNIKGSSNILGPAFVRAMNSNHR